MQTPCCAIYAGVRIPTRVPERLASSSSPANCARHRRRRLSGHRLWSAVDQAMSNPFIPYQIRTQLAPANAIIRRCKQVLEECSRREPPRARRSASEREALALTAYPSRAQLLLQHRSGLRWRRTWSSESPPRSAGRISLCPDAPYLSPESRRMRALLLGSQRSSDWFWRFRAKCVRHQGARYADRLMPLVWHAVPPVWR